MATVWPSDGPILINPNGRDDGWTTVSTGALTSLPAVALNASLVGGARYLDIELDFVLAGAAEPDYLLSLNGSTAIGSCIIDSTITVTVQVPRRLATVSFGGVQGAGFSGFKACATLELTSGRHRMFTCNSVGHSASLVSESSYVNGVITSTGLVVSTVQIIGTAVNNLSIGSRQRFTLRT